MSGQHPGRRGVSFLTDEDIYERARVLAIELGLSVGSFARMALEMHVMSDEEWSERGYDYPVFTERQQRGHDYPSSRGSGQPIPRDGNT